MYDSTIAPLSHLIDLWTPALVPELPGRTVVPREARAFVLAGLAGAGPLVAIVPGERDAEDLVDDLRLFTPEAHVLPAWETLPFEHVSPNVGTMAHRSEVRHLLREGDDDLVVIASVRSATQRVSPSDVAPLVLGGPESPPFDDVVAILAMSGYHRTDRVEGRGEFAVRGGIIDVYPAQAEEPVRIEFWGDDIDEIRAFSAATQRSTDKLDMVELFAPREFRPTSDVARAADALRQAEPWAAATWDKIAEGILFQGIESWLPWLAPEITLFDEAPRATRFVVFDPVRAVARSKELVQEEEALAEALADTWGVGSPDAGEHPALYLDFAAAVEEKPVLQAPPIAAGPGDVSMKLRGFGATPGDPESVAAALRRLLNGGTQVVVAMDGEAAAQRVSRTLAEHDVFLDVVPEVERGQSAVLPTGVHAGFVLADPEVAVLGEQEIAGRRRAHRRPGRRRRAAVDESYHDLEPGSYVVHHHHGIGRFEGLVHRAVAGVERDYLLLSYARDDKLYVPTDQLAAVRKYTGGETPRLSRLGGTDWSETRARVRQEVAVVAEEVIALHRERAQASGHRFEEDTPWQQEFEALFPFEETPDQLTAMADVKADMESETPMDRLVFGDVGFGKTEVAIRAVFKAVQSGKQTAVLVPTTLLAQQHHATFSDRLAPYPVRVEVLSRFLTAKQQRDVLNDLASGAVDVVIGTHRLLSDDVEFADLGLLVVDEEQRFGVNAKNKIKQMKVSVDVLTLTATPIPRTLEMALTGIREVSHIRTPPEDRHPILTYVGPYDDQAVSAAIRREMLREGQVFYVHNRIQSIDHAVVRLRALVPDARYAVAHGRMSEGQLEQVMFDFWNGEYDVLVATTIIESGLDLPQVNTLIVERADRLGLAQLYQLRGRVGRSDQRAYAYLFHPVEEILSEDAYRRLEAIGEASDLGAGFVLAMKDLEIRGAGSMLSQTQSGHIAAVGVDLYVELVADAVNELQGRPTAEPEPSEVRIELPVDAHLPAEYVPNQEGRLEAYRRLAAATEQSEVNDVVVEWLDRYGPLPPPAEALIDVARLRVEALRIGISELVKVRNEVRIAPVEFKSSQEVRLQRLAKRSVIRGDSLFIPAPESDPANTLLEFLRTMWPSPTEEPEST